MTPRPLIFISAVSKELRSARQLVANTLTFLGYQPVWQDIFGTESGDLRSVLREKIDQCKGVVQLVGQCYGAEPPTPDEKFGRVSYTQYEALYARDRGKKVWYLFIDESFPIDAHEPEPAELRELQAAYRRRLQTDAHIFHPLASHEALEAGVLKLRDDLTRLRRGVKRWAIGVTTLLVFVSVAIIWLVQAQRRQSGAIQKQGEQVTAIVGRYEKMQQALVRLAAVESQSKQPGEKLTPEEQRARALAVLEQELGLAAGTLAKELPAFALELYNRSDVTPLERARAAYALNKFDEAEKLSLEGAEQDQKAYETAKRAGEDKRKSALEGYELAGLSAWKRIQYPESLVQLRKGAQLTDRSRDPLEWARLQFIIGQVLYDKGDYREAERILREVLQERERHLGPADPETISTEHSVARALWRQGKSVEAEAELRTVLKLGEKVLGPEHPETLWARSNLAAVFDDQGKYIEAEAEDREVLRLREKVLGPEHPDTLGSRNNLAIVLDEQGKYAESESEFRAVLKLKEKVLGPEHPDTLSGRSNLAIVLAAQGRHVEAEAEDREVLRLREKVLGPEHPDTLSSRNNLAAQLDAEGKYVEAEAEYREVIKLREKVLGPEHRQTLFARHNLAAALENQGKYVQAEAECRQVIPLEERVVGPEHPHTLEARTNLADALRGRGKYAEAEAEYREVIKLREKVLGVKHPDTLESRSNLAVSLDGQGKETEAETQFRDVIRLEKKILGDEHQETLYSYHNFALCLSRQGKPQEATEFARRAVQGARKVLGPGHPDTKKYEKLLAELEANH